MTNSEIGKKAWDEAKKESEEKQIQEVKKIITETLKKLDGVKSQIKELQDEKKILELDIDDLKEGKLDRIVERQEKDPKAKKVSVVVIIKETIKETVNPWFIPYHTVWQEPARLWPNGFVTTNFSGYPELSNAGDLVPYGTINCSVAKTAAAGAYDVGGHVINLR